MYKCSIPQMLKCSHVPIFQCSNFQMFRCSDVQMFKCSNVQMFHIPMFQYSNVLIFQYSNVQMFKCSNIQIFKFSNVQMFKCQMSYLDVNKVKLLSERTSGIPPVIISIGFNIYNVAVCPCFLNFIIILNQRIRVYILNLSAKLYGEKPGEIVIDRRPIC